MGLKFSKKTIGLLAGSLLAAAPALAEQILFTNVNIFNGTDDKLISNQNVLVEDNLIKAIGSSVQAEADAKVINGGGRTLWAHTYVLETHKRVIMNVLVVFRMRCE